MLRRKLTILRRIIHRVNLFHFLVTILLVLLFSTGYLVRELLTKSPFQQDVAPSNKTKSCSRDQPLVWLWTCKDDGRCVRVRATSYTHLNIMSRAACKLTCNRYSIIWPKPTNDPNLSEDIVAFRADEIRFIGINAPNSQASKMLEEAKDIFLDHVLSMESKKLGTTCSSALIFDHRYKIHIKLAVTVDDAVTLNIQTNESYILDIHPTEEELSSSNIISAYIRAPSFFGARHALETLSQLILWDDLIGSLVIVKEAAVEDHPVFPHRGLLVDSARSYIEIPLMKRIIDGLSYNKMNVLHWHLSDSQSFPFVSEREPLMSLYGAYSSEKVYRSEDIKDLVYYALVRGVKIIPELDGPSHVGAGWDWGPEYLKGEMVMCYKKEPYHKYCVEPPCGILNPINENVYKVLGNIYKDMQELFQSDLFHMGGDEVKFDCWEESEAIAAFMRDRGWDSSSRTFQLWSYFQNRSLSELDKAYADKERPSVVLWDSQLTDKGRAYLDPERYIIQFRGKLGNDPNMRALLQQGYRLIMSNMDALYLDCGFHSWMGSDPGNNRCSPYKTWQQIYENSARKMISMHLQLSYHIHAHQILGGEAVMWSEQTDGASIEIKIWPRTSAFAERFWSDPRTSWIEALPRLRAQRDRMVERGIAADSIQMEYCEQTDCEYRPTVVENPDKPPVPVWKRGKKPIESS